MSDTPLALELTDVARHYSKGVAAIKALDAVTLRIAQGEFVAIMGRSGSGKTTLMNILGCLDRPTGGSYRVNGQEVSGLDANRQAALRRDNLGFIFQRYNLIATATAEENVQIPALYAGMNRHDRVARSQNLLTRLGIADRGSHTPAELSGGQQQRAAVARALVNDPRVILADEPTGALDTASGDEVMDLLRRLNDEGRTVIIVTHDEKVAAAAKRIVRIQDGRIVGDTGASSPAKSISQMPKATSRHPSLGAELAEAVHTALRSLRANFFRTALTLLGVIIGVAAVVAMLAVGQGSKERVIHDISALGTNLLSVFPGGPGARQTGGITSLIPDDQNAVAALPNVAAVSVNRAGQMTVRYGDRDFPTTVQAVSPSWPIVRDWHVARGDFFNARDVEHYAPVIVLGQAVAKILFPGGEDPIGRYILVHNIPFQVIGIMAGKGRAATSGPDPDNVAFVPWSVGLVRLFGSNYVSDLTVKVRDVTRINETQKSMTNLLKTRHQAEDFQVRNMAAILAAAAATQDTLTTLLGAIAAISLFVGGIGVMNIMLVSVTERTREIGIRMAVGARPRDIMLQFNTEAAVVCIVGGLLGILCGIVAGMVAQRFGVPVAFSTGPALLAFACAAATGIVFGYLPARKAAKMDPATALASE